MRTLRVVTLCVAVLVLTACPPDLGSSGGIGVDNRTDQALHFRILGDGEWHDLPATVGPRQSGGLLGRPALIGPSRIARDGCTIGELIALDPDGSEVARHPPGLCIDDVWVVEDSEPVESP